MQVKKDYMLHLVVRPGDVIYQYTTVWRHLASVENVLYWILYEDVLNYMGYGSLRIILHWKYLGI